MTEIDGKVPVIRAIAMPTDSNPYGSVFGGWLMAQMAQGCAALAAKHAKCKSVVVGADEVRFILPVNVGDELSVYAEFLKIGKSSMTISGTAYCRDRHEDELKLAASGIFTFVAVDKQNEPVRVPSLD